MEKDNVFLVATLTFLVLTAVILLLGFNPSGPIQSYICTDADCNLQQWLSALSGWAAVAAAIITIHFLRKQIDSTATHQRINFRFAAQANITLAKIAKQTSIETRAQIRIGTDQLEKKETPDREALAFCCALIEIGSDAIGGAVFREFEARIGNTAGITSGAMSNYLLSQVKSIMAVAESREAVPGEKVALMFAEGQTAIDRAVRFCSGVSDHADQYISDIEKFASEFR